MLKIHQQTQVNINKTTAKYLQKANRSSNSTRTYDVGNWVWIHLRKDRFPALRKNKLMPRADGPFQISAKYGDNAYKVDLPDTYGVSPIFNVGDLRPYYDDKELGTILPKEGGNEPCSDTDTSPDAGADTATTAQQRADLTPMTRSFTSAPNLGENRGMGITTHNDSVIGQGSPLNNPSTRKRDQNPRRQKIPVLEKRTVIFTKTSTPTLRETRESYKEGLDRLGLGLTKWADHQNPLVGPEEQAGIKNTSKGTGNRTPEEPADQVTLVSLLSLDLSSWNPTKAGNVISAHGPSHQGSTTILFTHLEA
ncbi:unnamed protein product [Amaranthus hypochondriacus]